MSMDARGLGIVATSILNTFLTIRMTNDSIDAKGMRAKALGAIGHKCTNLGRKGARPLMSMHAGGWEL